MRKRLSATFDDIVARENLCLAWEEFIPGKRQKPDVQSFARNLGDEIMSLHEALITVVYQHGPYLAFALHDPKPRQIHKASVRDRLLHHAIHRQLYQVFAQHFIADSYSWQIGKGTHKAMQSFQRKFWKVSQNNTRTCWVLKCDIRKFFASIDHDRLLTFIKERVVDAQVIGLLRLIISSFETSPGKGIHSVT
jgi:retron-type reverse transcriptase